MNLHLKLVIIWLAKSAACAFFFFYGFLPILLLNLTSIHNAVIFCHFLNVPFRNYFAIHTFGIETVGRNIRIPTKPGYFIGAWHLLPKHVSASVNAEDDFENALQNLSSRVVLYLHGNAFTRAESHRVQLMNVLNRENFHSVAIDYRGFGDSPGFPTEEGVIQDSLAAYQWIQSRTTTTAQIVIWGHSLGSAIGTSVAKRLCEAGACPSGLILDAAFSNFSSCVRTVKHTRLYRWFPWRDHILIDPCRKHLRIDMNSDANIAGVNVPILLLHAQDDDMVPVNLARDLFQSAKESGRTIKYVEFKSIYGYCHNDIWKAPNLGHILADFFKIVNGTTKNSEKATRMVV